MSEYERKAAQRALSELRETSGPAVLGGALAEHEQALDLFRRAQGAVHQALAREIARWSPSKLLAELQVTQVLVNQALQAGDFGGLERIYQEAKDSGDLHKLRAAGEVMKTALASAQATGRTTQEQRAEINKLVQQAAGDLAELRRTDEMHQAEQLAEDAWRHYSEIRTEARQAGQAINGEDPVSFYATGPLARALKRVKHDAQTGQVRILREDDPAVTGIYIKPENVSSGG